MVRFFPAAGLRNGSDGWSAYRGNLSLYWASSSSSNTHGFSLLSSAANTRLSADTRTNGLSVRCVAREVKKLLRLLLFFI